MEMPHPGPEHKRLGTLAGRWEGPETLHPSPFAPEGGATTGRWDLRMAAGGFFLLGDYAQTRDGQLNFAGHGVFGWDGEHCSMHWFDSTGFVAPVPATGDWDGNSLRLQHSLGAMSSRYELVLDDDKLGFTIENSADGSDWAPFLEGHYQRSG